MKTIVLLGPSGNKTSCKIVSEQTFADLSELFSFLDKLDATQKDIFVYQHFHHLIRNPAQTMGRKCVFYLNGKRLQLHEELELGEENLLEIKAGAYEKNTEWPDLQKRNIEDYKACRAVMNTLLTGLFDFGSFPIGEVKDFDTLRTSFPSLPEADKLRVLYRFARLLYEAPFENYSKLMTGLNFLPPLQMWRNIYNGHGGVCAEKTSALKFIVDLLQVENRPIFGSALPIKENIDQSLCDFIKNGAKGKIPFWLQHHMLEFTVDQQKVLCDVTNGNLPFLFLDQKDSELRFQSGLKCRMAYQLEKLHLYSSSPLSGDIMLSMSEYHSQSQAVKYIFKQKLGLLITDEFYLGAFVNWSPQRERVWQQYYSKKAQMANLPMPAFFHLENLHSIEDDRLRELMKKSLEALYDHYPLQEYRGEFTLILQQLYKRRKERVSLSLQGQIFSEKESQ